MFNIAIELFNKGDYNASMEVLVKVQKAQPKFAGAYQYISLCQWNLGNKPEAKKMAERKIRPELEAFDLGMINYAKYLITRKLLTPPYYFNLILGNIACAQADILHLGLMVKELPEHSIWSVGGIGDSQLKMNILSILSGGGVRVGLEDNIWYDGERTKLATNYLLVERVISIAKVMGFAPYTAPEARELFGLK
jgi:uncharacterized protein (DUF849 family)